MELLAGYWNSLRHQLQGSLDWVESRFRYDCDGASPADRRVSEHPVPLLVAAAVCLLLPSGKLLGQTPPAGTEFETPIRPNVILILCDNLGYGDIEPFGSPWNRTPNLSRMAAQGRKFTHFYVTAGVCTPSRASVLTGCYAQRVGMHTNPRDGQVLRPVSPYGLHPAELTMAEVLGPLGYATAIIGKWHLGDQPEFLPTRQGFGEFFGIPYSDDMTQEVGQRLAQRPNDTLQGNQWPPLPLMDGDRVLEAPVDRNLLTKRYTERAIDFIHRNRDRPFFLYLPHAMPGSTRQPFSSTEFRGRSRGGAWGDSVEEIDWSTGAILDALKRLEIDSRTLVIWTSDNGAPMAGDGSARRGSNAPLHGRGYTTSEGAFRVPTLMWWPEHITAGSTCDQLCTTMDLLPTCAMLAGVRELPEVDGHDIRPLLFSDAASPYQAFYYYERDQLQAVRAGPWKLFVPLPTFQRHPQFVAGQSDQPYLFDLVADIGCQTNVAKQHPQVVARLLNLAEAGREVLGDRGRAGTGQRPAGKSTGPPKPQLLGSP